MFKKENRGMLVGTILSIAALVLFIWGIAAMINNADAKDAKAYTLAMSNKDPRHGIVYLDNGGYKQCDGTTLVYTSESGLFSQGSLSPVPHSDECKVG